MENLPTIIVGLIVLLVFIYAVMKTKNTGGGCGCGCSGCKYACHQKGKKNKNEKGHPMG
ncbi:MAG: FeoB-associated Cys-rich membrane protein [Tissierellia bacterium]|nr:FeoB-associated Cys-rich membrane protein [Tissierellia bacterium]